MTDDLLDLSRRLDDLEAENRALKHQVHDLRRMIADADAPVAVESIATTRRTALRALAVGAAGVATGALVGARPAAAVGGLNSDVVNTVTGTTELHRSGGFGPALLLRLRDDISGSDVAAAAQTDLGGFTVVATGAGITSIASRPIIGVCTDPGVAVRGVSGIGTGLRGEGSVGVEAVGINVGILLRPSTGPGFPVPPDAPFAHVRFDGTGLPDPTTKAPDPAFDRLGSMLADEDGSLWFLAAPAAGRRGWRKVAGPETVGQLHLLDSPVRAYDSREAGVGATGAGPLDPVDVRVVSVTKGLDHTGARVTAVPPTALAAMLSVTVTNTTSAGFVALSPSSSVRPPTSTVNWERPGQNVSVTSVSRVTVRSVADPDDDVIVAVWNGPSAVDLVVDVIGYYR